MFPFPKNLIGKFLENWYFRLYKTSLFWTDAPSTINELVDRGIPRNQCIAIPCPIIIDKTVLSSVTKKEKVPTFIFVSRVVRMKGIEEVIKAFSFILQAEEKAQLWIIGGFEETYKRELEQMTKEYHVYERVFFYGSVSERQKYEYLSRAHLLLHASVKEGWGLVVLEAANFNTPSVVYNVNGLKDVVRDNETGIVIGNNSPQEMARAALDLYNNPKRYQKFQLNGKEWVRSLKWHDSVRLSLQLLEKSIDSAHNSTQT
jgi:glycosyltransferase involved in cell wall biosynthesis